MGDMKKVLDFLDEAGVFFLATEDGNQAKCRPLGFKMLKDGKLYFGVGTHKNVYKQLAANPKCEIVAVVKDHWLRMTGTAVFDTDPSYVEAAKETLPMLGDVYNEKTGLTLGIFHLENGEAKFCNIMGEAESVEKL